MPVVKDLLQKNDIVKNRWKVLSKIGHGGFGEIFTAYDEKRKETVAIKTELADETRQVLPMEVMVLKAMQGKKHAPKFFGCGTVRQCNYVVLELLSRSLAQIRRNSPHYRFSRGTCLYVTIQAIEALWDLHSTGFLHRDIKPSNFTMGLKGQTTRILFLLDYGLARRYLNKENAVHPPRSKVGFRGTARYASINIHEGKDAGRHDDLWSLFYSLVEMHTGYLPWRRIKEKDGVLFFKRKLTVEELCDDCPLEMLNFGKLVRNLNFHWQPQYQEMIAELEEGMKNAKFKWSDRLDWEVDFDPVIQEEIERGKIKGKASRKSKSETQATMETRSTQ